MDYEHDREAAAAPEPSLTEMTAAAIAALEAAAAADRDGDGGDGSDPGYYLMVEGGRVDHANHAGNLFRTVTDGVAYQHAVRYAMEHTDPQETLIISTADHSHGL
jgi:alkaline phosphatase